MSRTETVWRVRLVAAALLLVALCFHQAPGLVVPDTKLDLTADPGGLMSRALSLWDDNGLGQLQNQAYGYLFPIGPFHWALDALGLPSWVVQRLWWSTVLVVALWGFWRLAGALDIGTPWTRYVGAVLFAVSPRFLSEVAITSIEVWPMALAPWVLHPLVDPTARSTWSRLARSALAFGLTGGVNAVASGAALVLPTLWFVTRGTRRAVGHFLGWLGLCLTAALWWLVPLLVLGRYSPPFLDWIEDAGVTTSTASPFAALQGTSAWLGYLSGAEGPSWPAAWLLVSEPLLIVLTAGLAVLGLAGIAHHRVPERSWLLVSVVVGMGLVTAGFAGAGAGPFVPQLHALLDGPLAPLRNLHKFELVVRIPLLLGAVHALARIGRVGLVRQLPRSVVGGAVALLVVAVAAPGLTAAMPRVGGYPEIPAHWHDAAEWLDGRATAGSVLVVPAASFADFTWGSTKDEPLQALLDERAFAVRDAVPLGSAGSTRLLDEVERDLGSGRGSVALRRTLNDAGVRYLVVRNDLRASARIHGPLAVHEALAESGLTRVASFGPPVGSPFESEASTLDERTLLPFPSVEIFDTGAVRAARFVGASSLVSVTGGPEDLVSLAGVIPQDGAAILGSDRTSAGAVLQRAPEVLTDGLRRREVAFGRAAENTSDVLTAADPGRGSRRVSDYVADPAAPQTYVEWTGVAGVRASSSASDVNASLRLGPAYGPAAALDGDPHTRWVSGSYGRAVGEWLEVQLARPRDLAGLSVLLSDQSPVTAPPARIAVETDTGTEVTPAVAGVKWRLRVPAGETRRVRIRLEGIGEGLPNGFSISEVNLPGVTPRAGLVMPATVTGTPAAVVMRQQNAGRSGCHFAGERPLCSAAAVQAPEESAGIVRSFETGDSATYTWSGTVLPRPGEAVERLLDVPGRIRVTSSSRRVPAPAARPAAVVDTDLGTGWVAGSDDAAPTLELSLPEEREVTGLQFLVDPALAGSRPRKVTVVASDSARHTLEVDAEGWVRLPAVRTDRLTVTFLQDSRAVTVEAATGLKAFLPVGLSELRIEGADDLRTAIDPGWAVGTACGFGPSLEVDGQSHQTQVSGTMRQLLRGEPLAWRACGPHAGDGFALDAGRHSVVAASSGEFMPDELVLSSGSPRRQVGPPGVLRRGDSIIVDDRREPGVLVLPHTFSTGWTATDGAGRPLQALRVNGWQQGWILPAGPAVTVRPEFAPQRPYAAALAIGGVALAALAVFVALTTRRARTATVPRRGPAAPLSGGGGRWLAAAGLGVILVAGAGAVGVAAGMTALVLAAAARIRRWVPWAGLALFGALALAGVALGPWGRGGAALDSLAVSYAVWSAVAVATLMPRVARPDVRGS